MSDDLLTEFIAEASDHLGRAESILLAMHRTPDEVDAEAVNACFRALHTVKGCAGFLDLARVQHLAHAGEQVLDALRTKTQPGSPPVLDALLHTVARLQALIAALSGTEVQVPDDDADCIRLLEGGAQSAACHQSGNGMSRHGQIIETALAEIVALGPGEAKAIRVELGRLGAQVEKDGWCGEARHLVTRMRFLADALEGPDAADSYGRIVALFAEWSATHQARTEAANPVSSDPGDLATVVAADPALAAPMPTGPSGVVGRGEPPPGDVLADFVAEAQDLLTQAETTVVGRNQFTPDEVNAVFRAFHTVKGMAAYMGLAAIEQAAHGYETGFQPVRDGAAPADDGFTAAVLVGVDALRRLVAEVKTDIARRRAGTAPAPAPATATVAAPPVAEVPSPVPASAPSGSPASPPPGERLGDLLVEQGVSRHAVERAAVGLKTGQRIGDKLVAEGAATRQQVEQAVQVQQAIKTTGDGFSRVATAKLEDLMNQVGELLIAQAMVQHDPELVPNSHLAQSVTRQGRILRQLQVLSLSLRMVPLRGTFQKMARVVYDTAKKLGKQVEFSVSGEETEIDRTLAEAMGDPLMHMVRNGVDHGIEMPDERATTGKPAAGKLHLEAFHAGDDVVIRLSDDGKGMDAQKLRAKAIEKGLIDPARPMEEQECFQLIFLPGFSTAAKVTDVSGRGVGMDVVRRQVEAANGSIHITSNPGQGSVFIIRLPMTTAILDAMQLRVGAEHLLMPIGSVIEMLRPRSDQVKTLLGEGRVIEHRGRSLPVVCLAEELAIPGHQPDPAQGILVIIENRGSDYALQVDDILGQRQVVIKPFDQSVPHHPGTSGTTILGDGRVGLILNPAHLVRPRTGVLDAST